MAQPLFNFFKCLFYEITHVVPKGHISNNFSFEVGTDSEISFDAGLISTIAYRWTIGGKKKEKASKD